jgi:hypothetical protein
MGCCRLDRGCGSFIVDELLDCAHQLFCRGVYVNVRVSMQTGQELAFDNQDHRQPKDSPDAAHKFGPFLKRESMAHDCHVKMARTALMKYFFQGDRGNHLKAGHAQRAISAADQIA